MTAQNISLRSGATALMMWGFIYMLLAFISLELDNPQSRVAMVWLPAGAAVSACLSLPRLWWPGLYLTLIMVRYGLDMLMRHSMETSIIISLISISGDFLVAASVQYFGRHRDDAHKASVWLLCTFLVSALCAAAGSAWLSSRHAIPFTDTALLWWAANVSGNIVATTVLTGITFEPPRLKYQDVIKTFTCIMIVAITSSLIFSMPGGEEEHAGLIYGLACLPVLLMVVTPLVAGTQAGALTFLTLSIIVIFFSWHKDGPFFIRGLQFGEPLLLAQCYLSGTALLTIFIRLVLKSPEARGMQLSDDEISYRLNVSSGRIDWDPQGSDVLRSATSSLDHREVLLSSVSAEIRAMLLVRWQNVLSGTAENTPLIFRLTPPSGKALPVCERNLFFLADAAGGYIVGNWVLATGSERLLIEGSD